MKKKYLVHIFKGQGVGDVFDLSGLCTAGLKWGTGDSQPACSAIVSYVIFVVFHYTH